MASGGDVNAVITKEAESSYRSCPTLVRPNTTCMGDEMVNARDTTAIALVDRKSPTWRNAAFRLAQARLVLVLPREMLHFSRGQQHDSSHFSRKEQHNNNKPTNATTPLSRNQRYVLAPPRIPCVRIFLSAPRRLNQRNLLVLASLSRRLSPLGWVGWCLKMSLPFLLCELFAYRVS